MRLKNILCIVDEQDIETSVVSRAVALAERQQAELTIASVIEKIPDGENLPADAPSPDELSAGLSKSCAQKLEALAVPFRSRATIHTQVLTGTPFIEIIRTVLRNKHDLLIKHRESPPWLQRVLGSEDMHLLRKCPCPVWLDQPKSPDSYRNILAAVDVYDEEAREPESLETSNQLNRRILEMASSLALADFAQLHIAHAWEAIGEAVMKSAFVSVPDKAVKDYLREVRQRHSKALQRLVDEMAAGLGTEALSYLKPATHMEKGAAREIIPDLARRIDADLVVMGTIARTGIPGYLIGNTAENILQQLECSILALKPSGFRTPVTI